MGAIKGLIFDLDGVVVSTERNHFESWKQIAAMLNLHFDEEVNENLKGVSRADSLRFILKNSGTTIEEDRFEELLVKKNEFYRESLGALSGANILPGVEKVLKDAKNEGVKVMIGSSSRNARFILDKLGLLETFDHIVDGNDVANAKPDPEVFLKGAKAAGLNPVDCVVFEDAASGIEAAKKGGFKAIAVGNENIREMADEYLNTLEEFSL
ncbi:MAG: beta-phosphoglucomutase [Fluviicola sp. XM-24bin1]|nr:MAG: beta-phosphoglucomutase [Fluviicola sp. XM-24bin1]